MIFVSACLCVCVCVCVCTLSGAGAYAWWKPSFKSLKSSGPWLSVTGPCQSQWNPSMSTLPPTPLQCAMSIQGLHTCVRYVVIDFLLPTQYLLIRKFCPLMCICVWCTYLCVCVPHKSVLPQTGTYHWGHTHLPLNKPILPYPLD